MCAIATDCDGQSSGSALSTVEKAIGERDYLKAEKILKARLNELYAAKQYDSLPKYVEYVGKVAEQKSMETATTAVKAFVDKIESFKPSSNTLRVAYYEAGYYFGTIDRNQFAYSYMMEARRLAELARNQRNIIGKMESDMGTYAQRMGDINLSKTHHQRALAIYESLQEPNYESLYVCYNNIGSMMYYSSKVDSALYYFNLALKTLEKTERNIDNKYYRVAVVQNNLSGLYGLQGRTTESIKAIKACISNLKSFLEAKEPHPKKATAITFQYQAIDNLAAIYKGLGDFKQAHDLLQYSYRQKKKHLDSLNQAIFESEILIGQLYYDTREYDLARKYLTEGLKKLEDADGEHLYWRADGSHTMALLHDDLGDKKKAAYYYEKADSLYEETLQGDYDNVYLGFLGNLSQFYAQQGQLAKALQKTNKAHNYIIRNYGKGTLLAFEQLLNLTEVYLAAGKYREAHKYGRKSLDVVNEIIGSSDNMLDSIKVSLKKPRAILLKSKAAYHLLETKNVSNLTGLLTELNQALALLEKRKLVITDAENMSLLLAEHAELLEFVKKITIDIYSLTKKERYIDQLISLHESGMYNRIRARLDKNDSLPFAHISAKALATERQLKANITRALEGDQPHDEKIQAYFTATEAWNNFKEQLKTEHPRYYKMRYASIFKSSADVQASIPPNTTVIRYFFIGEELNALVIDNQRKEMVAISTKGLEEQIKTISQYGRDEQLVTDVLWRLYGQLWAPLARNVVNKHVVIVPDGILYNLSFELLTPTRISSYKEFATKSLLAKHAISYHYSLFLLQRNKQSAAMNNTFVAFAPGFSQSLKKQYKATVKDSMEMDDNYLHLLPQPFTVELAKKTKSLFGGNLFIANESTESAFKNKAGRHEIIHIGTHAESNNLHPEYSRLIFAKEEGNSKEDNNLFLSEIYNCDLSSSLTVLTACETGKPGYKDGEGMISLAHAFNFAGSESILMGLWKIEEKASAKIVETFYRNLITGMPKDEALRQAKLSYLTTKGSTLDPAYWAGMVLMGDTAPVSLPKRNYTMYWLGGLILVVGTCLIVINRRRSRRQVSQA